MHDFDVGDRVVAATDWHCLCGAEGCMVRAGEPVTISARGHFPVGRVFQFRERPQHTAGDDTPPWFIASGFKPYAAG